jgi:putative endonuclease
MSDYYVYIITNWDSQVMYIGVTNNLERRLYEHKTKAVKGFTTKYNLDRLVYFEQTGDVGAAIAREKQIKSWRREKKNALVKSINPEWRDLSADWACQDPSSLRSVGMTKWD